MSVWNFTIYKSSRQAFFSSWILQESIEKYGILNPLIVRPVPDGYYEIISGHRRKHAAEKLGYRKVPVIIRVLSEDDSILSMVDSVRP